MIGSDKIWNGLRCGVSLATVSLYATTALAQPIHAVVSAGNATVSDKGGGLTQITQTSNRAILDWQSFDIQSGERVDFAQPSSASIALNRIHDSKPSQIEGSLTANGQVWLTNPNGVMFGNGAQVNVGGLLATTADIEDDRFMNGDYRFDHPGNPLAWISNAGRIAIADGGLAALVGPNVTNTGLIRAKLGKVQLASGDTFALDLYGDGLLSLQASDALSQQIVSNSGAIVADGGSVLLTVAAANRAVDGLINVEGVIQANSVGDQEGHITVYAEGSNAVPGNISADKGQKDGNSTVLISGTLQARGNNAGEKGGVIEALGDWVGILGHAVLDASGDAGGGTIRVGGDYHGAGSTPTASRTIVQESTNIYANAVNTGKGGDVTVWADDRTDFAGTIEAKGGAQAGDGGFIETSGKESLAVSGKADASAPHGQAGTWLLDPNNAVISTGANTNESGDPNFTATGAAVINTTSITNDLDAGTNVNVAASGSITVANNISESAYNGTVGLTLAAGTDIVLNNNVAIAASGNSKLNVTLDSDTALGGGAIVMNSGSSITSNGGNVVLGGGANPLTTAAFGDGANIYGIYLNSASVNSGSGNVSLTGQSFSPDMSSNGCCGVSLGNSSISTTTGNITLTGFASPNSGYDGIGVFLGGASTLVSTVSGNVTVTGTGREGAPSGNCCGFGVWMDGGATIRSTGIGTGLGSIIVNGVGGDNGVATAGFNYGVYLNTGSTISSADADISITGRGLGTAAGLFNNGFVFYRGSVVESTGSGNITISATTNPGDTDIIAGGAINTLGNASGIGTITLVADTLPASLNSVIHTTGSVVFRPRTASTTIGVAGGAGTLGITNGILGAITAGSVTVGNSGDTGTMTVGALTLTNNTVLDAGTGVMNFGGAVDGNYNLTATAGTFSFVSAFGGVTPLSAVSLTSTDSLILPSITAANIFAQTTGVSSDITIPVGKVLTGSGSNTGITLASGRNFINNAGSGALTAPSGRWLVYSATPASDTTGSLANDFKRFACTFGGTCLGLPSSGNGLLYAQSLGPDISQAILDTITYTTSTQFLGVNYQFEVNSAPLFSLDFHQSEVDGSSPGMDTTSATKCESKNSHGRLSETANGKMGKCPIK